MTEPEITIHELKEAIDESNGDLETLFSPEEMLLLLDALKKNEEAARVLDAFRARLLNRIENPADPITDGEPVNPDD